MVGDVRRSEQSGESKQVPYNVKKKENGFLWEVVFFSCLIKLCLVWTYKSTDFEVHRNWLAITYSLPVNKWYHENTSQWTLDYPPFFAWFEYALAHVAYFFDSEMLDVKNLNYSSAGTVWFQRLSVIICDSVLIIGVSKCCSYIKTHRSRKSTNWKYKWFSPTAVLQILILCNSGLLIVDHMHFQYNGFLLGILLISTAEVLEGNFLLSAFWYTVLLNMKHIFLYVSPVYFVYFFRNYCFARNSKICANNFLPERFCKLGALVLTVTLFSFGPYIYYNQMGQVFSRLFPVERGLTHAYWAPNIWALYNFADVILSKLLGTHRSSVTSGLVQESTLSVLPNITPTVTLVLTLLSLCPCLYRLWFCSNNPLHFPRSIVLCSSLSFLFGYHVHEKAILIPLIPLTITSVLNPREAKIFLLFSFCSLYSLLPLIFTPLESILKFILFFTYTIYTFVSLNNLLARHRSRCSLPFLNIYETLYLSGFVFLFLFETFLQYVYGLDLKFPFLNLMLISVYSSLGLIYCIGNYYFYFFFYDTYKIKSN